MWAMIVKEFRQVRRDRRTLAMMIVLPVLLLVVLGYAASFDVKSITVAVSGPQARLVAGTLRTPFDVTLSAPDRGASRARDQLRQKLAVIGAMLHQPELIVRDEPTTGVDPVSRSGLWWLIARAAAEGCAIVLATTYLDEAERCTSVLVLDAGRALASGTAEKVVADMPGTLRAVRAKPGGEAAGRAWRRAGQWRVWDPGDGDAAPGAGQGSGPAEDLITADLQDAVTVAALASALASAGAA
jgi:ABC-type uncharacterized transport system ATPase subunit